MRELLMHNDWLSRSNSSTTCSTSWTRPAALPERQSLNHLNLEGGEPTTTTEKVPARPMTAADMQGAKSTFGMHSMSHSVWCKCQRGGSQHKYPTETVSTYADVLKYCKELGCEIKTHEELCSWAHFSPGVAKGGRFTSFSCSCCGYAPSEKQWRADMKEFNEMNDADQNAEGCSCCPSQNGQAHSLRCRW